MLHFGILFQLLYIRPFFMTTFQNFILSINLTVFYLWFYLIIDSSTNIDFN